MEKLLQILIVLFIITKFNPRMCYEISNIPNGEIKVEISTFESPLMIPINSTPSDENIIPKTNFNDSQMKVPVLKAENVFNKSIEYLIEEPNYSNSSHNQEVIIKPLKEVSVHLKNNFTTPNSENEQKLFKKLTDTGNQSKESIVEELADPLRNLPLENSVQNLNIEKVILPAREKKEELIINLLSPLHNGVTTSILKESIISSNKSDIINQTRAENQIPTALNKESNQILQNRLLKEPTMTSIKMRINPLNKILKFLTKESATLSNHHEELTLKHKTTENQSQEETLNTEPTISTYEKMKPITLHQQFIEKVETINSINDHELVTTAANLMNHSTNSHELTLKFQDYSNHLAVSNADELVNPANAENSTTPSWASKSEEEESTTKPLKTLEEYAVKQMNFILDHMLLESQEFVAKVLQATGNTIFQRDHLKRYIEIINRLLNPQYESHYSDDITDSNPVIQQDLYEEVVRKLNFFKSKATKQLQLHLPADWVKDYKDAREELKIWLDKASNEMHREFNLYINEEEDHIKYLYFNEAFDDITRATEIHQKLALLADLIKIVKNKKQITFMDLYMQ